MKKNTSADVVEKLDAVIDSMRCAARIPGMGVAIVVDDQVVMARGYGHRDLESRRPLDAATVYPLASTTKALTAALLGALVDEGLLAWDVPVQQYLPWFRLRDSCYGAEVTLRDLMVMRTGLPRHDFLWMENPISRDELARCLAHLPLSASSRERFQYNNLTVITAAHAAEVVTGKSWEELLQQRILEPLEMRNTGFCLSTDNITTAYHENSRRELVATRPLSIDVSGPCGGTLKSTVEDMARWLRFNLSGGEPSGVVQPQTLREIHTPQVTCGADPSAPTPGALYAIGWFADTYNGHERLSHGGYVHDVNSEVTLFPQHGIGVVSFANFGAPGLPRLINQLSFDAIVGLASAQTLEEKLALYEKKVADTRKRNEVVTRVQGTVPSHALEDYTGRYKHPGYGAIEIIQQGVGLLLRRGDLVLPLEHWHYDAWIAQDTQMFTIHMPHIFDRASRMLFETNMDGEVCAVSLNLESGTPAARFQKDRCK